MVEVHLSSGLPMFNLVGLPETEVKEARDRVRAALQNSKFDFPQWRITVNLAPAELPKESGRCDLPIAIGILVATGQLKAKHVAGYEFAGELALTGELRPIRGALAMTLKAHRDGRAFILPKASAAGPAPTHLEPPCSRRKHAWTGACRARERAPRRSFGARRSERRPRAAD